jgi:ribosomal protein S18 acetylase RimI-like enzyme
VCGVRLHVEQDNTRAQRTYEAMGMARGRYLVYETGHE